MKFQISAFSKREHMRAPARYSRPSSYLRALSAQTGDVPRSQISFGRRSVNDLTARLCEAFMKMRCVSRAAIKTEIISSTSDRITQDWLPAPRKLRTPNTEKREFYVFFSPQTQTRANII